MKKLLLFVLFVILTIVGYSQTTYTVNSTDDTPDSNINDSVCADANGNCTLRAAIQNTNKTNNKDTIRFNIPGAGPFVITVITEEFPDILRPLILDGRTQPGYTSAPLIEIDGSGLPIDNSGLKFYGRSDNSEIYGLSIGGFKRLDVYPYSGGFAIDVWSQNLIVQSNYLGLKPDGTTLNRNEWGAYFYKSGNNTFGGIDANQRNVVSGSYAGGVTFDGIESSNNIVQGNLLGTDATGLLPRGNRFNLQLLNAPNNTIGGNTPQARNILSAGINSYDAQMDGTGISISGLNSTNNTIIGNYIGTDITGNSALPNMRGGILLLFGANKNNIGGEGAGERNVISGNGEYGIFLQAGDGTPVSSNSIKGNYIGVNATGDSSLGSKAGIMLWSGETDNNTIGGTTINSRNIISGNELGIAIRLGKNNQITGNYIGTNASGTAAIPNRIGVTISDENNTVGGKTTGARNIISGNGTGIDFSENASIGSKVIGNYIGLNASGNAALSNGVGVVLGTTSMSVVIGGDDPLERNIISGNTDNGITVWGSIHVIKNNYIGLNASGAAAIPNTNGIVLMPSSSYCIVGGANAVNRNIISGNSEIGIYGTGTSHTIRNNYIGLNPNGDEVIKNGNDGARFNGTSTLTQISENVISGNGTTSGSARNVNFLAANGFRFFGNKVGTLPDGITGVVNIGQGIVLNNSSDNTIGGDSELEGNIIGDHDSNAISVILGSSNNTFSYNKIGVGADGITNLRNGKKGIGISGNNVGNKIMKNIIANNQKGVELDPALGISTQVTISENSIYNNSVIGIDLIGTTTNDVGDADVGVNNLQNTPEISTIKYLGSDYIEIKYEVTSTETNSAYPLLIEFFGAVNGQGKFFITSDVYPEPGVKTISIDLPSGYDPDDYSNIVATATDANGNTSEFGVNVSYTLSISQFENHNVKLYPNPVSNRLFLQFPSSENYNLKMVNTLGQVVLDQNHRASSLELDVSTLSNGLYFLNVTSANRSSETLKFIKN